MKRLLIIIGILLCIPSLVLAEAKSIMVDNETVADGACYKNVCYDEKNNLITLDNANALVHSNNFNELNVEIKNNVIMDFSTAGDSYLYYDANADNYNIHLNKNSTLTIKNLNEEYIIGFVRNLNITGEENSKIIFENCKYGISVEGSFINITGVDIKAKNAIDYILHVESNSLDNTVLLKNVNIQAEQRARVDNITELYERAIIGVNNGNLKLENTSIDSIAYGFYKDIHRASDNAIYVVGNIEIINSNVILENYSSAINSANDITINNSNIKIKNCQSGIEGTNVTFNSGTYINKYLLTDEDYMEPPSIDFGIGLTASKVLLIKNGYLEFSGSVVPGSVLTFEEEGSIVIGNNLTVSKNYNITKFTIPEMGIAIFVMSKPTSPSEKPIDINEGLISGEQTIFDYMYDDLLLDVTFTGKRFIHLDSNNASGSIFDIERSYLDDSLPENKFTPLDNKKFKGWSLTPNGETITNIGNYSEVTLYAIWEESKTESAKENPNTGMVISIPLLIGLIILGTVGIKITNRKRKFN